LKPLPILAEHPRWLQAFLVFVVPAAYGAVTGYFLGVSESTYLILSIVGVVGGIGAGFDHVGAAPGAGRGAIAGSIFGTAILLAHEIHGAAAKADLPDPAVLLVLVTTLLGIAFGALGGWMRARAVSRAAMASP
jgi:hypothetical protein